jgi:hypothetical protein
MARLALAQRAKQVLLREQLLPMGRPQWAVELSGPGRKQMVRLLRARAQWEQAWCVPLWRPLPSLVIRLWRRIPRRRRL